MTTPDSPADDTKLRRDLYAMAHVLERHGFVVLSPHGALVTSAGRQLAGARGPSRGPNHVPARTRVLGALEALSRPATIRMIQPAIIGAGGPMISRQTISMILTDLLREERVVRTFQGMGNPVAWRLIK